MQLLRFTLLKVMTSLNNTVPASMAQLDARTTGDQQVAGFNPCRVGNILSWRFDHEIFST